MTPARTTVRNVSRKIAPHTTVALIPGVPVGTILTHAAGTSRIEATLAGKVPLDIRNPIIQKTIFDAFDGKVRGYFDTREGEGGSIEVEGEVTAFDAEFMGRAVEAVMRRMSGVAALLDAVLEAKVVREAEPMSASEETVSTLARDLSEAGFSIRADVLWSPSPGGDMWLGIGRGGREAEAMREFVETHPSWRVI